MKEVIIATIFLLLSISIGILRIIKLDRGVYIQDIRLFFLLSFSLYIVFLPIIYCFFSDIMPFNERVFANMVWLYTSSIVAYDIVLFQYNTRWYNPPLSDKHYISYKKPFLLLALLVAYSFYYMRSQGIQTFSLGENMSSRSEYGEAVHQSWIVLSILIAVIFNFLLFHFKRFHFSQKIVFLGLLFFYVAYQVSLGNRREYMSIILFFVCYYLCIRKIPLNSKMLFFLVVGFIGSFLLPMIRDANTRDLQSKDLIQAAVLSNEFIYPQQTSYYTMLASPDLKFGYTYTILPIQVAIPRAIYPNKPPTLGTEFITKIINTTQGYAYTPVTEAYINFGYIGPFIVFYLLALFLNYLVRKTRTKGVSFVYMIIFASSFDFCRSEFSSVAYSFFFIFVTYYVIQILCGRRKKRQNVGSGQLKHLKNTARYH